ncbi:hypothetical protein EDC96DRAFT_550328 [Choanephora cucurbitarum]|nr:hypothetical protein EDC96DRAFT_550328 [Choanephora cucurbitarum]
MPKSTDNIKAKLLAKLDDMSSETSNVVTNIKSMQDQLDDISKETKSLMTRMKNLEDQIDASKHQKNDEIHDMEGSTFTIPYPTKFSKASGKIVKRKPLAEDVKDALAVLIPGAPVHETYNSVLKYCTARSDEVVKAVYNNKPPTWKHVPTSTRSKIYMKATKLIANGHGVNMERCEKPWKHRNVSDNDKNDRNAEDESESEEADEETGSESENDEVAFSQFQKRKSKCLMRLQETIKRIHYTASEVFGIQLCNVGSSYYAGSQQAFVAITRLLGILGQPIPPWYLLSSSNHLMLGDELLSIGS